METMEIGGRNYPVNGYEFSEIVKEIVPIADMPMMSDYTWQQICLQDRLEHPERYAANEDVDATIAFLRKWLEEHSEERTGVA